MCPEPGRPTGILARWRASLARRPRPRGLLLWWVLVVAVVASAVTLILRIDDGALAVTSSQRGMIDELENALLHDSVSPQYARVVNQYDGRGFTTGIGDFSTADGGALDVVRTYTARVGDNALARTYLSTLESLAAAGSGEAQALIGFPDAWRTASVDGAFRQAQSDVLDTRFYQPAFRRAEQLGLRSALGVAAVYDALLQHGAANDPDGLPALISKADGRAGGTARDVGEQEWLRAFLDERRLMLDGPGEPVHQAMWPLTTGRVEVLAGLLTAGHLDLAPPIKVNPYGTPHILDPNADGEALTPAPTATGLTPIPHPSPTGRATVGPTTPPTGTPPRTTSSVPRPTSTSTSTGRAPVPATPRAGLTVRLVNQASGKALSAPNGSFDDGAVVVQYGISSSRTQQWRLSVSGAGCFMVINERTAKALDDPNGSADWGVLVQQWSAGPADNINQAWCFEPAGSGLYVVRSLANNLVLDLQDGQPGDGAVIQLWPFAPANPNQLWRVEAV